MPYKIKRLKPMVDLSTYCNAACPQCHRTDQEDISKKNYWLPLVQWSLETFKKRFPAQDFYLYKRITLCGTWGDPMMNKDILEIITYILESSRRVQILINTNGSMRNEEFWWNLGILNYKYNLRLTVVFAIDGATQEQHATYRRKTELDKVLLHMKAFTESGSEAKVYTVVFKHNENDIKKIAKLAYDNGACYMYICPSNRFNRNLDPFKFVYEDKVETLYAPEKITKFTELLLTKETDNLLEAKRILV